MKLNRVDINDLIPFEHNPRYLDTQGYKSLCKKLIENGFIAPLFVNSKHPYNNIVYGGNHRLMVAKDLIKKNIKSKRGDDFKKLPVIYNELDYEEMLNHAIILNTHEARWNYDLLLDLTGSYNLNLSQTADLTQIPQVKLAEIIDVKPKQGRDYKFFKIKCTPQEFKKLQSKYKTNKDFIDYAQIKTNTQ